VSRQRAKVLFLAHGHPDERPGGAEIYAWDLFQATRQSEVFDTFYLARADSQHADAAAKFHRGDNRIALLPTAGENYDLFSHELYSAEYYHRHALPRIRSWRPDIVHVQHTLFLGLGLLVELRREFPKLKIVYTLHDYHFICHRDGLLVTVPDEQPCRNPRPEACSRCFPQYSIEAFYFRRHHLLSRLVETVDLFHAPNEILADRYREWGLPAEKILVEPFDHWTQPAVDQPDLRPPSGMTEHRKRLEGWYAALLQEQRPC
jgi:hypothetical protein